MRSVFSFKALIFPVLCVCGVLTGIVGYVMEEMLTEDVLPLWFSVLVIAFLGFVFCWIFFGEFRTKIVRLDLGDKDLKIKRYGGLGRTRTYTYKELDGYRISLLPSATGEYEYLYILKGGKKVCKISEFYHTNYFEMRGILRIKIPDMGQEKFDLEDEIKGTFS